MTIDEWISKAEDGILKARYFIETSSNEGEVFVVKQELPRLEANLKALRFKKAQDELILNQDTRMQ